MRGLIFAVLTFGVVLASAQSAPTDFWSQPRKGANHLNDIPTAEWFADAQKVELEFVRLLPVNWKPEGRDFLIGDADGFKGIPEADFQTLKKTLDWAEEHGIKVVVGMVSLPGARWRQHNDMKNDSRIPAKSKASDETRTR